MIYQWTALTTRDCDVQCTFVRVCIMCRLHWMTASLSSLRNVTEKMLISFWNNLKWFCVSALRQKILKLQRPWKLSKPLLCLNGAVYSNGGILLTHRNADCNNNSHFNILMSNNWNGEDFWLSHHFSSIKT